MGKRAKSVGDRALTKADENSVYAVIVRSLGYDKFEVYCSDTMKRTALIRGNMIKRVWMKENDIVLCSLREGDGRYCDIELKYTDTEIKRLKEGGYITDDLLNQKGGSLDSKIDFSQL